MLPDPARYEERYRLTGAALGLASSLLALGLGFLWHAQLIFAALTVLLAIPAVLAIARRPVAFRADHAGITLGSDRLLPRRPAVFIPWTDVERIILYPGRKAAGVGDYIWAGGEVECIGVLRREGAPALPYGNKQAPGCPVPGVVAGATRRVIHWRLDRERLAAVTAAVAPGIAVIEARNDPARRIEGPGQRQDRQSRAV
ncbi:MAG TPA: hypothetical protein VIY52_01230 [Streptosporangiaceae bacterium]